MLPYGSWRAVAFLALIPLVWLPVACPSRGQEIDSLGEVAPPLPEDFYLAGEPASDDPVTGAPPKPAPLPQTPPPSRTQADPPQRSPRQPSSQPARRPDMSSLLASRSSLIRWGGLPNMFGDSYGGQLQVCNIAGCDIADIPPPGGTRRAKISENDKALPMDRVFFTYNHFHNAIDTSLVGSGTRSLSIDQYTFGLEKTFRDGLYSVELRMPFSRTPQVAGTDLLLDGGDVGNFTVTFKRLLFATRTTAVGIGLPIQTPTGSDVRGWGAVSDMSVSNDAVYLAPFIGFLNMPNERIFCEGFLQVDLAANGNRVVFGGNNIGRLSEQNLLYVDLALGYWLHRNPQSRFLTGVATMVEYHYTTTLQDADVVSGTDGHQLLQFGNTFNRMDISNLTVGFHTEFGKTTVRVGGAFPLSGNSNRLYDAELQVSVNRRF